MAEFDAKKKAEEVVSQITKKIGEFAEQYSNPSEEQIASINEQLLEAIKLIIQRAYDDAGDSDDNDSDNKARLKKQLSLLLHPDKLITESVNYPFKAHKDFLDKIHFQTGQIQVIVTETKGSAARFFEQIFQTDFGQSKEKEFGETFGKTIENYPRPWNYFALAIALLSFLLAVVIGAAILLPKFIFSFGKWLARKLFSLATAFNYGYQINTYLYSQLNIGEGITYDFEQIVATENAARQHKWLEEQNETYGQFGSTTWTWMQAPDFTSEIEEEIKQARSSEIPVPLAVRFKSMGAALWNTLTNPGLREGNEAEGSLLAYVTYPLRVLLALVFGIVLTVVELTKRLLDRASSIVLSLTTVPFLELVLNVLILPATINGAIQKSRSQGFFRNVKGVFAGLWSLLRDYGPYAIEMSVYTASFGGIAFAMFGLNPLLIGLAGATGLMTYLVADKTDSVLSRVGLAGLIGVPAATFFVLSILGGTPFIAAALPFALPATLLLQLTIVMLGSFIATLVVSECLPTVGDAILGVFAGLKQVMQGGQKAEDDYDSYPFNLSELETGPESELNLEPSENFKAHESYAKTLVLDEHFPHTESTRYALVRFSRSEQTVEGLYKDPKAARLVRSFDYENELKIFEMTSWKHTEGGKGQKRLFAKPLGSKNSEFVQYESHANYQDPQNFNKTHRIYTPSSSN